MEHSEPKPVSLLLRAFQLLDQLTEGGALVRQWDAEQRQAQSDGVMFSLKRSSRRSKHAAPVRGVSKP